MHGVVFDIFDWSRTGAGLVLVLPASQRRGRERVADADGNSAPSVNGAGGEETTPPWSMIWKSVQRFSEKIMLKQQPKAR